MLIAGSARFPQVQSQRYPECKYPSDHLYLLAFPAKNPNWRGHAHFKDFHHRSLFPDFGLPEGVSAGAVDGSEKPNTTKIIQPHSLMTIESLARMRRALAIGVVLSAPSYGLAQATAAGSAAPGTEEDLIELSPFEVSSETDEGYRATSTLAGTRIRTELRDVGAAIQVVTKEFMTDIGATDNTTLLQYTTNTEVSGTRGVYTGLGNGAQLDETNRLLAPNTVNRVRGLSEAENTRDFFVSDIPWDAYNVDRVDIQRGPNSILFGLGKPAGIINASLAGGAFRDEYRADIQFGSHGSLRGSLSLNKELVDDVLAMRVGGLWDHEKFMQDPAYEDDERLYVAARFDPQIFDTETMRTSFKVKFEHGEIDANRPRTVTPVDGVSPWFNPVEVSASNPFGGLGKVQIDNPYDAFSEYQQSGGSNYLPWLTGADINAQQPYWLFDGATGDVLDARSGPINNGARAPDGSVLGASSGLGGKRFGSAFVGIGKLNDVASNVGLDLAEYGQYRAQSMRDAGIFDFYGTLLDGPTKSEFSEWDALNLDASQTFFNDRLGFQVIYDKQDYLRGGEALLGYQPRIQVDMLQRWDDLSANPNVGRPFVQTGGGGGEGSSYESEREYIRGSVYGELRASDFLQEESLLEKLLGTHRLNGVYSQEDYQTESLSWQRHAATQDWYAFWGQNDGSTVGFDERPPTGIIYLGGSVAGASSASAANIPGIAAPVDLMSSTVNLFDTTWNAPASVMFDAPWTVPDAFAGVVFSEDPPQDEGYLQNSNPDNYVGWRAHQIDMMSYGLGADRRLTKGAQLSQRETTSTAFTWQGYWWNDSIVTTLGWREDEVKSRGYTAREVPGNRSYLDLSPDTYRLPDSYEPGRVFKDNSTSGGVVVHLNRLMGDSDFLPINVSLSYNRSNNFEVTDVRNDLYANPIANPTGKTEDYGILFATKDNKYTFRVVKYESEVKLASTGLENAGDLGGVIANGMNWRNVFLYDLALYDWPSRNRGVGTADGYRNTITNAYPEVDPNYDPNDPDSEPDPEAPQARALEDQIITGWNQVQAWLTERGFFEAWGFTPQDLSSLTDRSTYEASLKAVNGNPLPVGVPIDPESQFIPSDTSLVSLYGATEPQNFTVTGDTLSEGYEFEFTANPLPNWRLAFNASEAKAYRNNVGGAAIQEFVDYMDGVLLDPSNTDGLRPGYTAVGATPRWGNPGGALGLSYSSWRANYTRMKLQEGTAVPELRRWQFRAVTNYSFTEGSLKGLGVGGSYRWLDKVALGYPLVPDEDALFSFDIDNPIYGPSEDAVDLWVSYSRQLTDRLNWRIQLNVRNVFASDELIPVSVQPDNSTYAGLRIAPAREWFITNSFSF